jgi:hypothetical protein
MGGLFEKFRFILSTWQLLGTFISVAEPEPHLLVGAGSGAVMRCGSGSDGSVSDSGKIHG